MRTIDHTITMRSKRVPVRVVLFAILALVLVPSVSQAVSVSLSCDMRIELSFERFDPAVDTLVVRGAFNSWSGNGSVLVDPDGDGVYEITLDLAAGTHPYKFVIPFATYDRWEHSIDDRLVTVSDEPVAVAPAFFDHRVGWTPGTTRCGADISFTHQLDSAGAEYRVEGEPVDLFEACADHGHEIIRLRLWHTPAEPWHGLPATILMAQQAKAAGLEFMLDFHYSDSWADPGQQHKPAAWEGIPFAALVDSVYAYTNAAVRALRDAGALPEYVQVGNEISTGMLWEDGRVGWEGSEWDTPEQWDDFAALLSAGVAGVRDSLSPDEQPVVIIHWADGANNAGCRWFYDNLVSRGVSFDCIGLSFYPWWHGTIWELRDNLADLATRYAKEIMVVETAYPWTLDWFDETNNFVWQESQLHANYPATPDGQFEFLRDLVAVVEAIPGGLGTGVLYWEPGYLAVDGGPGSPYENLTTFDFDGDALRGFGFPQPWSTGVEPGDLPGHDGGPGADGDGDGESDAADVADTPDTADAPDTADTADTGEEHGNRAILSPAVPNPFRGSAALSLTVPSPSSRVRVRVLDVTGRVVATLADGQLSPGRHDLVWHGTDDAGRPVASGVYLIGGTVGEDRVTARLVRLR